MTVDVFWQDFLIANHKDNKTLYFEAPHSEEGEQLANQLLELVGTGKKQAAASSLFAFEIGHNKIPQVGSDSIVTDWNGKPYCAIETAAITILPFRKICLLFLRTSKSYTQDKNVLKQAPKSEKAFGSLRYFLLLCYF